MKLTFAAKGGHTSGKKLAEKVQDTIHHMVQNGETEKDFKGVNGLAATPNGPVQHALVDLEAAFIAQTHHTERVGDGSLSGSKNRA